ncbi:KH domain-containing protein [Candidatus Dependentiae bacterium]|nr:KH domain-containing protein [Candidatus Dependentiae bacterium]
MLKAAIEYAVKMIVDDQDSVSVNEQQDGDKIRFIIKVADRDIARVIGKEGRTIKALRRLAKLIGPADKEISIDIK